MDNNKNTIPKININISPKNIPSKINVISNNMKKVKYQIECSSINITPIIINII